MKVFLVVLATLCAVSGCTSPNTAPAANAVNQTRDGFADAAMAPLEDLNLRREQIPPLLARLSNPYDLPADFTCEQIGTMIHELDEVLGPDWDTSSPDERLRTEKLADEAAEAALGAVETGVTGWIPYRSVLREATGAAGHMRKYNQAYKIGAQRRTYLKGIGLAMQCELPARPDFESMTARDDGRIIYK